MTTPVGGPTLVPVENTPAQLVPQLGQGQSVFVLNLDTVANLYLGYTSAIAIGNSLQLAPGASTVIDASRTVWAFTDAVTPPILAQVSPGTSQYNLGPSQILAELDVVGLATAIAQALYASGLPQVAAPIQLYNTGSTTPNPPILFGTNEVTWAAEIAAGVTGMSTTIGYVPQSGPGFVRGIPPVWPSIGSNGNGVFPVGPTQIINFSPDIPTTLSGANDTLLATYLGGAPNGSWIMAYHECNLPANGLTPSQVIALDAYLLAKVHAINPTLKYGRGFATTAQTYMGGPAAFMSTGMDFYGMDGYQHTNASATPSSIFDATRNEILGVAPTAQIAIIETGTGLSVSNWFNAIATYAITNGLLAVQSYFSTGPGTQPWQNTFAAAMNAVSAQLAASGTIPGIAAGATETFGPINPSPVAGYASAQGLSYDILVSSTAGAASTIPWVKLSLHWFNDDLTNAQEISLQQWLIPLATNGLGTTRIQGTGPQRGRFLQVKAVNLDTVTATVQLKLNSISRTVNRDNFRWDVNSSPNIPTYIRAPDGGGNVNQLAGVQTRSVPPGTNTLVYLCGLYAGKCWVRLGTAATSPVITVQLVPQPSAVFNGTALFNEIIQGTSAGSTGDFVTELILPRAPCLLTFSNSDTVAHNVFASIITGD